MSNTLGPRLRGVIPPVITPLTNEGQFDATSARRVFQYMMGCGVHGLFLFGSSSEGPSLTTETRAEAIDIAKSVTDGRVPILIGVMEPATHRVIQRANEAKQSGADGIVVCPPFYFPTTQKEVLRHFRAVREAVDLPILAYDIPVTTKIKIATNTMLELAREGTIVALKDSSGDLTAFRRLVVQKPEELRLFTGSEIVVDTCLLMGAHGTVPGLANVATRPYVEMFDHWQKGEFDKAVELQHRLARLGAVFENPEGPPNTGYAFGSMKAAMKIRGVIETCRLTEPFTQVTPEHEARVKRLLEETDLL